jgi:hypothetical protein
VDIWGRVTTEEYSKALYKFSEVMKMNNERWNSENLYKRNTDEYKYLTEIDELINISDKINKTLRKIHNNEYFEIQKEERKDKCDFTETKKKLIELENLINEL